MSFAYLHRDDGNYKIFGEVIFTNNEDITPSEAEIILRKNLIDSEFFYPEENGIPLFSEHTGFSYFSDWYEFQNFSKTNEEPTDFRDLNNFLRHFKVQTR